MPNFGSTTSTPRYLPTNPLWNPCTNTPGFAGISGACKLDVCMVTWVHPSWAADFKCRLHASNETACQLKQARARQQQQVGPKGQWRKAAQERGPGCSCQGARQLACGGGTFLCYGSSEHCGQLTCPDQALGRHLSALMLQGEAAVLRARGQAQS